MTGDDNFTKIHIEAALEQCSVFVVLNTTFQQTEPEITNKIETFCQNNCSGHGICKDGRFAFPLNTMEVFDFIFFFNMNSLEIEINFVNG